MSDYERIAFERWLNNGHHCGADENMWKSWLARSLLDGTQITWQPIETAPKGAKDYTWMQLAWGPEEDRCIGNGFRWGDRFFVSATFHCLGQEKKYEAREIEVSPTHWMPLPDAPR